MFLFKLQSSLAKKYIEREPLEIFFYEKFPDALNYDITKSFIDPER